MLPFQLQKLNSVSGCLGTQEAIWLKRFIEGLGKTLNTSMLNMDNQGIADTLTKALAKPSFEKFNQMMDLIENNDQEGVLQK